MTRQRPSCVLVPPGRQRCERCSGDGTSQCCQLCISLLMSHNIMHLFADSRATHTNA